jgi:hypothetical protein
LHDVAMRLILEGLCSTLRLSNIVSS